MIGKTCFVALSLTVALGAQISVSATTTEFTAVRPGFPNPWIPFMALDPGGLPNPVSVSYSYPLHGQTVTSYSLTQAAGTSSVEIRSENAGGSAALAPDWGGQVDVSFGLTSAQPTIVDLVIRFRRNLVNAQYASGSASGLVDVPGYDSVPLRGWQSGTRTVTVLVGSAATFVHVDFEQLVETDHPVGGSVGIAQTVLFEMDIVPVSRPAAAIPFGTGCQGTAGVPVLAPSSLPNLGEDYVQQVSSLPGGASLGIEFGFSDDAWFGLPLPFDLGVIGMIGCLQYIDVAWVELATADAGGVATHALSLPLDPGLLDLTLFSQAFIIDVGANPLGGTMSNALGGTFGVP